MQKDATGILINGDWKRSGEHLSSINPATEESLGTVHNAGKEEVEAAVAAARSSLPEWGEECRGKSSNLRERRGNTP